MNNPLIDRIREHLERLDANPTSRAGAPLPPLNLAQVTGAENRLGLQLPALLRDLYLHIGNGAFGPGHGLLRLDGDASDECGLVVTSLYAKFCEREPDHPDWIWPRNLLPVCNWGWAGISCVDTSDDGAPVIRFRRWGGRGPAFLNESESLLAWLEDWLNGRPSPLAIPRPKRADIVGKRIESVLRTEWEHFERLSSCDFFLEFADGTLVELGFFGDLTLIDRTAPETPTLVDIHCDPDFPALWTKGGYSGAGALVEKVLVNDPREEHGEVYLILSGGHCLKPELEEGQTALQVYDTDDFVNTFDWLELFDYWTREPATVY